MKHYSHRLIEKYTVALLDLFNDIHIAYRKSNKTLIYQKVPLKFRSRERAVSLAEFSNEEIIKGNTNILPRASLSFIGMEKAQQRNTSKYNKVINVVDRETGSKFIYNSTSYDYTFSLIFITRTLTEATQVVEQIMPLFNPSYTLNINEISLNDEPTTVILEADAPQFEIDDDHSDDNIRLITTEIPLTLKGNLYLPIQEHGIIEMSRIYLADWLLDDNNEYVKSVKFESKGNIETGVKSEETITDFRPMVSTKQVPPTITNVIVSETHPLVDTMVDITVNVNDEDNEEDELYYVWKIDGNGKIVNGDGRHASVHILNNGIITVTVAVIDYHGNQSDMETIEFNV